eukprot:TRINITY_DN18504_c0_g1_i3.p1 TRINITY_DN18504_c0_g1~~TRINITY_DN18504_c0_g1_i3.p1  ORF type:complete len:198 (+),score=21.80 TRINITY_DN18504_c0_g1_i3:147-740(+)
MCIRDRHIIQSLIGINVLHGIAQLVMGIITWDDACDQSFQHLLVACGVANICQVSLYSLVCMDQDTLWPRDEDDDEEMGWPLHVAGFVLWLCWIVDFTSWLAICLLYHRTHHCDSTVEHTALSTVVIRAFLLFLQLLLTIGHVKAKIRAENKRKLGPNPFKVKKGSRYLGEYDEEYDKEIERELEAMGYYNEPADNV